eukprot:TRINITY_DN105382_c2_g1_i1.p1 TRINITY_DN105382_c2_g1~~TRINITY_DN105382_c2_g1_i1.p1  ORF type:complete len:520 (-),score=29.16 TRINITY_DN105382_c2_g1_i1:1876-3435(-)
MKPIIYVLVILFIIQTQTEASTITAPQYATFIRPNYYNLTSLSKQEESTLRWWIDFKNKIPRFTMYLEWLEFNSFRPQYRQYREGVGMVGIYYLTFFDFCILLSSLLLFFKIYMFGKDDYYFGYKKNKSAQRSADAMIVPLVLIAISALIFYVGAVITSYGNIAIYLGVRQARDLIKSESETLTENVLKVRDELKFVNESWTSLGSDASDITIDSAYFYEKLTPYAKEVNRRVDEVADPALWFEIGRFTWVWLQIIISLLIVIFALAGYMPCRYAGIVISGSIIVFGIFAEISALLAYSSSELLMISDICEQAYKISQEDSIPYGETGIGYFMIPISPDHTGVVLLYLLKAGKAYDTVMESFNKNLKYLNYKEKLVTTTAEVSTLLAKDSYSYEGSMQLKGKMIKSLDSAIRAIYDIKNNRHIREFANDAQDKLCLTALTKCSYAYVGLGLLTISSIFIVIICIQLVKLRKVPKLQAVAKMIGLSKRVQKLKPHQLSCVYSLLCMRGNSASSQPQDISM